MKRVIFTAIIFLFILSGLVFSDDAPIRSVGKTIQPLKDVQVRMVSENVSISLSNKGAFVDCTFELLNEGPPDTIDVGFPRGWEADLLEFKVFITNGKRRELEVKDATSEPFYGEWNGQKLPWWKTFKVPFTKTGETVKIRNSYWTPLIIDGNVGIEDYAFTYITKTGAFWKGGTIDHAEFRVYMLNNKSGQFTKISPEGYEYEYPRVIMWSFDNYKPDKNIEIMIMQDMIYDRKVIAEKMLARNPDDSFAHFLIGTVYFCQQWWDKHNYSYNDKAKEEFIKAITFDPGNLDSRWFLSFCYSIGKDRKQNYEKIKEQLEEILKEKPDYKCDDNLFINSFIANIGRGESVKRWLEEINNE